MNEQQYRQLQRRTERICALILNSEYPAVDIVVERSLLRSEVAERFPEQEELYDMIFESRFDRLWAQFRAGGN